MREFFASVLKIFGFALWVEIVTELPECIYYFGPFASRKDAETALPGYVEDLKQENAKIVKSEIKRCRPRNLTIYNDKEDANPKKTLATPILSGQI